MLKQNKKKRKKKRKGMSAVAVDKPSVLGVGSFFNTPKKPHLQESKEPASAWSVLSEEKATKLMQKYLSRRSKIKASVLPADLLQSTIAHFDQQCSIALGLPTNTFAISNTEMKKSRDVLGQQFATYYQAIIQHSRERAVIAAIQCFDQLCADDFHLELLADARDYEYYSECELLFKMLDQYLEITDTGVFLPPQPHKAKIIWQKTRCDPLVLAVQDLQGTETRFGINEKFLRGQGLARHRLTPMDLRRTLALMQLQDKVSVGHLSVEDIGLLLHSHGAQPMLLSRNNAWLSAIFIINKNKVSALIEHSFPLIDKEQKEIITVFEEVLPYLWSAHEIELRVAEIKTAEDWNSGNIALLNIVRTFKLSNESNPHLQGFLTTANIRRTLIEMHLSALKLKESDMERLSVPKAITEYFSPVDASSISYSYTLHHITKESLENILSFCMLPGKENKLLVSVMNLMPFLNWQVCPEPIKFHFRANFATRLGAQTAEARLRRALRWCGIDKNKVHLLVRQDQEKYFLIWGQVTESLLVTIEDGVNELIRKNNSSYQYLFYSIKAKHTSEHANEGLSINWQELTGKLYAGATELQCFPKNGTLNELPKLLSGDVIVTKLLIYDVRPIMLENIATVVKENRTIRNLSFFNHNNKDVVDGLEILTKALANHQYIDDLDLNFVIDNKGMHAVSDMLTTNQSIQELDMIDPVDKFDSGKHPLTAGLLKNSALKRLRIRAANSRMKAICSALPGNHSLAYLTFYHGDLDAKQDHTIFDGLGEATALKTLKFDFCKIGVAEACSIAAELTSNSSLETLEFNYNSEIGDQGASAFAQMMSRNTSLRKLLLCTSSCGDANSISDKGLIALGQALPKSKLKSLAVAGKFSKIGLEELVKGLEGNSTLLNLDISTSNFYREDQLMGQIKQLLARNHLALARSSLTELIIAHSSFYSPIAKLMVDYVIDEKDQKELEKYSSYSKANTRC